MIIIVPALLEDTVESHSSRLEYEHFLRITQKTVVIALHVIFNITMFALHRLLTFMNRQLKFMNKVTGQCV